MNFYAPRHFKRFYSLSILFIGLFQWVSVFADTKLEYAEIAKNEVLEGGYHEISFRKNDHSAFQDFEPGDLLYLYKPAWLERHDPHVYAISGFDPKGTELKIIVSPRFRGGIQSVPESWKPISQQLSEARVGNTEFQIQVLKAHRSKLFEGEIAMIGFGEAATQQLGIIRHLAETGYAHPIKLVHAKKIGENPFLEKEFRSLAEGKLKGLFQYIPYLTAGKSDIPMPHLQESFDEHIPSYFVEFIRLASSEATQNKIPWSLLITAHDANYTQTSPIESQLEGILSESVSKGIQPPNFYHSTWDRIDFGPFHRN